MSINLRDSQKHLIKWLVEKTQEGKLGEEFFVRWAFGGGADITNIELEEGEEEQPKITRGALDALEAAGLLLCRAANVGVSCTLTQTAFATVANNFEETGTLMTDIQAILKKLQSNLLDLKEREAKYGGNAPVDLLNQIDDHRVAIGLTEQLIGAVADLRDGLGPLNIDSDLKDRLLSILGGK